MAPYPSSGSSEIAPGEENPTASLVKKFHLEKYNLHDLAVERAVDVRRLKTPAAGNAAIPVAPELFILGSLLDEQHLGAVNGVRLRRITPFCIKR